MIRWPAWLVLIGACRLGFDPPGTSALDGAAPTCRPSAEICNGIDDDCNGVIDEGCPCAPIDVTLALAIFFDVPGVMWTGGNYMTFAVDSTRTYLQMIGIDGSLGPTTTLAAISAMYTAEGTEAIAWNGRELAVVWVRSNGVIALTRFDANGAMLGTTDVSGGPAGFEPIIAWDGDRYAIAWSTATPTSVQLREVDLGGAPLTNELVVPGGTTSVHALAPVPGGYLLASGLSGDPPTVVFVDRSGAVGGTHILDAATNVNDVALVRGASGVGAVWAHISNQLYFQTLGFDGAPLGTPTPIMNESGPATDGAATATSSGYAVIGQSVVSGPTLLDDETDLDASGTITAGPTTRASTTTGMYAPPAVLATDHRLAFQIGLLTSKRIIVACP